MAKIENIHQKAMLFHGIFCCQIKMFVDCSFLQGFRFASPLPVFLTPLSGLCGADS